MRREDVSLLAAFTDAVVSAPSQYQKLAEVALSPQRIRAAGARAGGFLQLREPPTEVKKSVQALVSAIGQESGQTLKPTPGELGRVAKSLLDSFKKSEKLAGFLLVWSARNRLVHARSSEEVEFSKGILSKVFAPNEREIEVAGWGRIENPLFGLQSSRVRPG